MFHSKLVLAGGIALGVCASVSAEANPVNCSSGSSCFSANNSSTGEAIIGTTSSTINPAVHGIGYSSVGVTGTSLTGNGVWGYSGYGYGVLAESISGHALHAVSAGSEGVVGEGGNGSGAAGVWGISNGSNGYSLYGSGDMRIVAHGSQSGTATKPGGGSWSAPSDARIKKDVSDFKPGLAEIAKIRPVRYKYNGLAGTSDNGVEYVGVIAQELEKVMPSMVTSRKTTLREADGAPIDLKMVDDTAFTYALINSVNQLSAQNQELQKRLDRLETGKPPALAGLAMDGSVGALGIGVGIGIAVMRARRRSDDLREK
jgi:hypothetical protein